MGKILSTLLTVVIAVVGSAARLGRRQPHLRPGAAQLEHVPGPHRRRLRLRPRRHPRRQPRRSRGRSPASSTGCGCRSCSPSCSALWFGIVTVMPDRTTRLVTSLVIAAAIAVGLGLLVRRRLPAGARGAAADRLDRRRRRRRRRCSADAPALDATRCRRAARRGRRVGRRRRGARADIGGGSACGGDRRLPRPRARSSASGSASPTTPSCPSRLRIDRRSRAVIFLGPALLFIFATLVVPTIRTIYLSFLDDNSEEWVGLDNYKETFQNPTPGTPRTSTTSSRASCSGSVSSRLGVAVFFGIKNKRRPARRSRSATRRRRRSSSAACSAPSHCSRPCAARSRTTCGGPSP